MSSISRAALVLVALALCACQVRAQSSALPSAPIPEANDKASVHNEAERQLKLEERQRILAVVPNFNTVIGGRALPLSPGQKLDLATHNAIDPFNLLGAVFVGGLDELTGSNRGYGWGPAGYFKRAGAQFTDTVDGAMLSGGVYPILFHQDPRFFRQGSAPKRERILHALLAAFVCRGDDGKTQPNYSNILGNFTAGAISNTYYPSNERGLSLTIVNASIVTLEGSAANLAVEFAPDIAARWNARHNPNR
jgi:hypothetical protein